MNSKRAPTMASAVKYSQYLNQQSKGARKDSQQRKLSQRGRCDEDQNKENYRDLHNIARKSPITSKPGKSPIQTSKMSNITSLALKEQVYLPPSLYKNFQSFSSMAHGLQQPSGVGTPMSQAILNPLKINRSRCQTPRPDRSPISRAARDTKADVTPNRIRHPIDPQVTGKSVTPTREGRQAITTTRLNPPAQARPQSREFTVYHSNRPLTTFQEFQLSKSKEPSENRREYDRTTYRSERGYSGLGERKSSVPNFIEAKGYETSERQRTLNDLIDPAEMDYLMRKYAYIFEKIPK